jgi:hypothetical protein
LERNLDKIRRIGVRTGRMVVVALRGIGRGRLRRVVRAQARLYFCLIVRAIIGTRDKLKEKETYAPRIMEALVPCLFVV